MQLLKNWQIKRLWDISNIAYGKNLATKDFKNTGYPVFWANWVIGFNDKYLYENEMLLISCRWAASWKVNMSPKQCFITNNSLVLSLNETKEEHRKYIYFFLKIIDKSKIVTWSAQPQVTINNVTNLEIPLPSLETQHLIVSEIEKQFSRLDEWLSSLLRIRANLKSYRASLLKSAIEWRLTEEWRAENPDIESADLLLNRIRTARKEKWIQENPGKKYREPEIVKEVIEWVALPEIWVWVRLEQVTEIISDWDHNAPPKAKSWVPFITIWNITNNTIDFSRTFFVLDEYFKKLKITRKPFRWDVLYTVTWSFGIPVLIDFDFDFCFQRHIWLVRPSEGFTQKFLFYLLQSNLVFSQANKTATWTAQKTVWLESIRNFKIPLPPLLEQHRIVEILEEKFSVIDSLESLVHANIRRAENLKQAILKKAFSGELVWENH